MTRPTGDDAAGALASLRTVLASIEAGDLPAETDQVAWLRGAAAALGIVTGEIQAPLPLSHNQDNETPEPRPG